MGVFLSQWTLGIPVYMKDGPATKNPGLLAQVPCNTLNLHLEIEVTMR